LESAIEKYDHIRQKRPDDPTINLVLASLYNRKGETQKARTIYEEMVKKHPESAAAMNNLAFHLAEHEPTPGNLARAEKIMAPILEKHRSMANLVDTAAWIQYRKGDMEKAKNMLLDLGPKVREAPVLAYHLGMIFKELGDLEKAKDFLELAAKSGEPFEGRENAEKALLELR
jgi:Flp pilus assembly protein TadD